MVHGDPDINKSGVGWDSQSTLKVSPRSGVPVRCPHRVLIRSSTSVPQMGLKPLRIAASVSRQPSLLNTPTVGPVLIGFLQNDRAVSIGNCSRHLKSGLREEIAAATCRAMQHPISCRAAIRSGCISRVISVENMGWSGLKPNRDCSFLDRLDPYL